jgi:hypothetical protein
LQFLGRATPVTMFGGAAEFYFLTQRDRTPSAQMPFDSDKKTVVLGSDEPLLEAGHGGIQRCTSHLIFLILENCFHPIHRLLSARRIISCSRHCCPASPFELSTHVRLSSLPDTLHSTNLATYQSSRRRLLTLMYALSDRSWRVLVLMLFYLAANKQDGHFHWYVSAPLMLLTPP